MVIQDHFVSKRDSLDFSGGMIHSMTGCIRMEDLRHSAKPNKRLPSYNRKKGE